MDLDILKDAIDKLSDNDIRHGLTYTIKSNNIIKILVEDSIDFDTLKYLFGSIEEKVTKKYLRIVINSEITIIFIKINVNDFNISRFYYSWETLTFMMIHILSSMNIDFTDRGIFYNLNGKRIYLTNNIRYILDFLYLDVDVYRNGFNEQLDELKYAMTSIYFNPEVFKNVEIYPKNFFNEELNSILEFIKINIPEEFDHKELDFNDIDIFFPGFLEKYSKFKLKENLQN